MMDTIKISPDNKHIVATEDERLIIEESRSPKLRSDETNAMLKVVLVTLSLKSFSWLSLKFPMSLLLLVVYSLLSIVHCVNVS